MSPRSGSSFLHEEVKDQCDSQNVSLEEIYNLAKNPRSDYVTKTDLRIAMRKNLPKLSRELIDRILRDFKGEKIDKQDYLVYFGMREEVDETEESKEKNQREWINEFTDALNSHKINPIKFAEMVDVNKDGIIDLKELEKVLKEKVKASKLNFKDLQHILNAFDMNKDGKVTTKEYEAAVRKYGTFKEASQDEIIVEEAKQACKSRGTTLKSTLAECEFNQDKQISIINAQKRIREGTGFDKVKANQLIEAIKDKENREITGDNIFEFFDEHLPDDMNIELELKYIIASAKYEQAESILYFLINHVGMNPKADLLIKIFTTNLEDALLIGKSSAENIYEEVKNVRPEIPNPNIVDFFLLILNQRDIDIIPNEVLNLKKLQNQLKERLENKYSKPLTESMALFSKAIGCSISATSTDKINRYKFMEAFVDISQLTTARECLQIFNEILGDDNPKRHKPTDTIDAKDVYVFIVGDREKTETPKRAPDNKQVDIKDAGSEEGKDEFEDEEEEEVEPKKEDKPAKPSQKSVVAQIETKTDIFVPIIYTRIKKSVITKMENLHSYIEPFYKKAKVSPELINSACNEIMAGEDQLNFKQFYQNIDKYTTFKMSSTNRQTQLYELFEETVKGTPNFDAAKDKGFINAILNLPRNSKNKYEKFELIKTFYANTKDFKGKALTVKEKAFGGGTARSDGKKPSSLEEEKEEPSDDKPKPPKSAFSLFGKKGQAEEEKKDDNDGAIKLLDQIKEGIETDFTAFRKKDDSVDGDPSKSFIEDKDEQKKFNQLISTFIGDFSKIVTTENIKLNIDKVSDFFNKHNGSKNFIELRNYTK